MNKILNLRHLRGDLFGGLTAGIVALPLALAFGVYSGLGATAGLYGAIALGFFAALLGGTPTQVSGPTGPMTVLSAVIIANAIQQWGSIDSAMGMILMIFLLTGLFQILFGLIRIGEYIRYIPYPVVSGFMSGVGVIIILLQLFPLMGSTAPTGTLEVIKQLHTAIMVVNWNCLALAAGTIGIIYLFPYITRAVPSQLIALIVMTTIYTLWKPFDVQTIGHIPEGLPQLHLDTLLEFPFLSHLQTLLIPAITLAALGIIDSLLTSVVADNLTKTKHNSNKELIGQGIGNMAASLIGGLPGAGATMRTVVNIQTGGRTRLSGMIHSLVLLVILLGAGKYAAEIPLAVLSGILITVGISIIDYRGIKHLRLIPLSDAAVMIIVFVMTVFIDLLQAVAVGMILSSVLFMKKMSEVSEQRSSGNKLKDIPIQIKVSAEDSETAKATAESIAEILTQQVYIKDLYGPLFFGFTSHFQKMLLAVPEVKVVVLRMDHVPYIDQSGLYVIEDALLYLAEKGIKVAIVGLQIEPEDMLRRIDIIPALVPDELLFEDMGSCFKWLESHFIESHL